MFKMVKFIINTTKTISIHRFNIILLQNRETYNEAKSLLLQIIPN